MATTNIFFALSFTQIAKEKLNYSVLTSFNKMKRKKERESDNGSQKRERCQLYRDLRSIKTPWH